MVNIRSYVKENINSQRILMILKQRQQNNFSVFSAEESFYYKSKLSLIWPQSHSAPRFKIMREKKIPFTKSNLCRYLQIYISYKLYFLMISVFLPCVGVVESAPVLQ